MIFKSKHIKGDGRGHSVGFPTINLTIPDNFLLEDGVHAAWVTVGSKTYKGALHYGPIPTFDISLKSMEVYLLDITDENAPDTSNIELEIDIVEYIRPVEKFLTTEDLSFAISNDVKKIGNILS